MQKHRHERLGDYIRTARKACGMSLPFAADAVGIHKGSLSRLERGLLADKIDPLLLRKVAAAVGADYAEMLRILGYLDPSEAESTPNKYIDEIVRLGRTLSTGEARELLDLTRSWLARSKGEKTDTNEKKNNSRVGSSRRPVRRPLRRRDETR